MKTKEARLDELLSKDEIHVLLARYCRGCDRCDEPLLASVFHSDAVIKYGYFKGSGPGFAKWATDLHKTLLHTSHFILKSLIKVNGNFASGETYAHSWQRRQREDGTFEDAVYGARYIDRFERRQDVWKIAARSAIRDWVTTLPVPDEAVRDLSSPMMRDLRSREDLSYDVTD